MSGARCRGKIFPRHGAAFRRGHRARLGCVEQRVTSAIAACRTAAALGGHIEQCGDRWLVRHGLSYGGQEAGQSYPSGKHRGGE